MFVTWWGWSSREGTNAGDSGHNEKTGTWTYVGKEGMGFPVQGGLAGAPRSRATCPFCWCHRHSLDRPPWRHSRMVGSIHSLPLCHQTHGPCIRVAKERGCLTCTGEITGPPGYWAAILQWVLPTGHWYRTKRCPHSILLSEVCPHHSPSLSPSGRIPAGLWWIRQKPSCQKSVRSLPTGPSLYRRWRICSILKDFLLLLSIMPPRPWGSSSFQESVNILYRHIRSNSFPLQSAGHRNLLTWQWGHKNGWGNRGRMPNADDICSYNTSVLLGCVWGWSHRYHFPDGLLISLPDVIIW